MKKHLSEINTDTDEGKLLLAALAMLTTELYPWLYTDEVMEKLSALSDQMFELETKCETSHR